MSNEFNTRPSLLLRLREEQNEDDWELFYRQYARFILAVATRYGLPSDHAQDLLQETMLEMMRVLKKFQYDKNKGSFRGFLRTVVTRKAARFRKRLPYDLSLDVTQQTSRESLADLLEDESSPSPVLEMERAWRDATVEEAFNRLTEAGAREEHLDVLRMLLAGETSAEIERATGVKANAQYQVKHRLVPQLKTELAQLLEDLNW